MSITTPTRGRDGSVPSRPAGPPSGRRRTVLALAVALAATLVGVAAYAVRPGTAPDRAGRTVDDLRLDWEARSGGAQVLGGRRVPGVPSVQRFRHDDVLFTLTVAPARPGPNLVRVDTSGVRGDRLVAHTSHAGPGRAVWVGTRADFDAGEQVRAQARPGATGLWADVDLPEGTGTLLVSHGPEHLVPFAVDTGSATAPAAWTGPDGPECLTAATAALLAGGEPGETCPAEALAPADADALVAVVRTLGERGVEELAVEQDGSARSAAAYDVVAGAARDAGIEVVRPDAPLGRRNALLVVSGWDDAATSLAAVTAQPLRRQPIRSDGTWLAPWLLTPGVVDSTAGAVLPLDFDIRDPRAQEFSQTLAALFPGQAPTSAGYLAWRSAREDDPDGLRLYAATRTAYMPAEPGHGSHGSEVAWFPGGTVTPVAGVLRWPMTSPHPAPSSARPGPTEKGTTVMALTEHARDLRVAPPAPPAPPPQAGIVLAGVALAVVLGGTVVVANGQVPGLLFAIGLALGFVLFHSRFGFTSAWRQLVAVRQGKALRAHMLMLAVACTLFAPILANQVSLHDVPVAPTLAPIGWGLFVGAFLFGVGMQLGGSCASGTLFAIGSGQSAILLTLAGFVGGATLGALHLPWWNALPAHAPVSLTQFGGYPGALAISLTVMAAITALTYVVGRRADAPPLEEPPVASGPARVVRGSWPLWVGALLLAGLNALTLVVSGGAWGVTFAFALWGSKLLDLVGVDVLGWGFWQDPANLAKYQAGILAEKTSVMDLGIIVGAMVASALAGQWVLHRRVPGRLALGAVLGGVMMGYGARLAFGCNIGAYFGGIASFSLHGWLWGVLAIAGTFGGLALRPLFGLTNPRPTDSVC